VGCEVGSSVGIDEGMVDGTLVGDSVHGVDAKHA